MKVKKSKREKKKKLYIIGKKNDPCDDFKAKKPSPIGVTKSKRMENKNSFCRIAKLKTVKLNLLKILYIFCFYSKEKLFHVSINEIVIGKQLYI